jgi:hypothetical protein
MEFQHFLQEMACVVEKNTFGPILTNMQNRYTRPVFMFCLLAFLGFEKAMT